LLKPVTHTAPSAATAIDLAPSMSAPPIDTE
jgi:hypothetical protein